jgi:hypothetical protein
MPAFAIVAVAQKIKITVIRLPAGRTGPIGWLAMT